MVHAARYYEFFEDAFLDWLDVHAGGYRQLRERTGTDLVIVAGGCEYRAPARLDDDLTIDCRAERVGRTSLTLRCTVRRGDEVLAIGRTTYVCMRAALRPPFPTCCGWRDEPAQRVTGSGRTRACAAPW
jgi:YbgC/YbaW family acyl-CoA thioester hydrolase